MSPNFFNDESDVPTLPQTVTLLLKLLSGYTPYTSVASSPNSLKGTSTFPVWAKVVSMATIIVGCCADDFSERQKKSTIATAYKIFLILLYNTKRRNMFSCKKKTPC